MKGEGMRRMIGIFTLLLISLLVGFGQQLPQPPTNALAIVTGGPLTLPTANLPPVKCNVLYYARLPLVGGTPPFHWKLTSPLPQGLSLNPNTGEITGIPSGPEVCSPASTKKAPVKMKAKGKTPERLKCSGPLTH
jgi:hypothetical protein